MCIINMIKKSRLLLFCLILVLGTFEYRDDVMATSTVTNGTELLADDLIVTDGTKLYTSVKCVNNIGLATIEVSRSILISMEPPRESVADLTFIPSSVYKLAETEVAIQPNLSYLQFSWDSFTDDLSVSSYEYRLLSENIKLVNWTDTGKKNFVSTNSLNLEDGQWYTAEVRALNKIGLRSNVVNSTILVDSSEPTLTGKDRNGRHSLYFKNKNQK